uniref:Uncharacterized protein n=1 Tax=Noccaea caerulescens TaxID=107243 RepID=A0A1J3IA01_NOCCA
MPFPCLGHSFTDCFHGGEATIDQAIHGNSDPAITPVGGRHILFLEEVSAVVKSGIEPESKLEAKGAKDQTC